jgi:hypothetical protein
MSFPADEPVAIVVSAEDAALMAEAHDLCLFLDEACEMPEATKQALNRIAASIERANRLKMIR